MRSVNSESSKGRNAAFELGNDTPGTRHFDGIGGQRFACKPTGHVRPAVRTCRERGRVAERGSAMFSEAVRIRLDVH